MAEPIDPSEKVPLLIGRVTAESYLSGPHSEPFIQREIHQWVLKNFGQVSEGMEYHVSLKEQIDGYTVECGISISWRGQVWASKRQAPGVHAAVRTAIRALVRPVS